MSTPETPKPVWELEELLGKMFLHKNGIPICAMTCAVDIEHVSEYKTILSTLNESESLQAQLAEANVMIFEQKESWDFLLQQRDDLAVKLTAETARADNAEKQLAIIGEIAVVEFDGETVGKVDAVIKATKYRDFIRDFFDKIKERDALAKQVAVLSDVFKRNGQTLLTYSAECFPEIVNGQKHFVRVLMESIALEMAEALAATRPAGEEEKTSIPMHALEYSVIENQQGGFAAHGTIRITRDVCAKTKREALIKLRKAMALWARCDETDIHFITPEGFATSEVPNTSAQELP